MVKAAKSYQQKYEKIMGESGEDELWSDIERDIAEFKKKVELGKADGYFWNMYFNLLRSNRLMFAGINKAFITGDMAYMLNGIYRKIVSIAFIEIERIAEEHRQLISSKL